VSLQNKNVFLSFFKDHKHFEWKSKCILHIEKCGIGYVISLIFRSSVKSCDKKELKNKYLSWDWWQSMDIKTDNATSNSPRQLFQKWNFSQYQRCLALPWAFPALIFQWKKSQVSWF